MEIRKAWIHTYVKHDGERVPWKIASSKDQLKALTSDDRVEEVSIFNEEELERFKEMVLGTARIYVKHGPCRCKC